MGGLRIRKIAHAFVQGVSMSSLSATRDDVIHAYRLLLGREADPSGFANYESLVREGIDVYDLARMFMTSPEFCARMGRLCGVASSEGPPDQSSALTCHPCTRRQIESPNFLYWASRMGLKPGDLHRKSWEWCFIVQALNERGVFATGRRGLGFAVGEEPLTSLFAGMGCEILATDLDIAQASRGGWVDGKQHASGVNQLNARGFCSPELFAANVRFRSVDMRKIPADLEKFDFLWSSCALEHLGSLGNGIDFLLRAMECLRPGGVAVHTTELNVESDSRTLEAGRDVIYRKRDLLHLAGEMAARGHRVEPFDFDVGDTDADRYVDDPPYTGKIHLKLRIGGFASTSYGLIITRGVS
jgi:hypothetical protein